MLPGAWDLRGHESAYLGGVDVAGKRVLELGPATGYLTFYMERMGADVVSFEAGFDVSIDLLPVQGVDHPDERLRVMQETIDRNHDGWWYLHRAFGSSAKFVQGNIYDMPADLGTFDITLVGRHPLAPARALGRPLQAAARTTDTMIVTEPLQDDIAATRDQHHAVLPSAEHHMTNWWSIYPGAVVSMLRASASGGPRRRMHTQRHHLAHDIGARRHRAAHVHRRGSPPGLRRSAHAPRGDDLESLTARPTQTRRGTLR